jgi:hypothetical protein
MKCKIIGIGGGAIPFIASLAVDYVGAKTIAVVTTPADIIPDNSKHYGYLIEYPVLKRKEDLL